MTLLRHNHGRRFADFALAAALLAPAAAMAEPIADFYHGKTINLYVSFPPGGGYDIYARVLLPYFTPPHPGQSLDRGQEHGGRQRRAGGRLYLHHHAAGRHLARPVPRHLDARQGAGRTGRVRSGQAGVDRPHRVDRDARHGVAHLGGAIDRGGQAAADHHRGQRSLQQLLVHSDRAQRSDRHQVQDRARLPGLAPDGAGDGARRGRRHRRHELGSDPD